MLAIQANNPIILPLSNPSDQSECTPQDVIDTMEGKVYVATGSPFTVTRDAVEQDISQCNNIYAFPGISCAMVAAKATCLTGQMMESAAEAISDYTVKKYGKEKLLTPKLDDLRAVSMAVSKSIINKADEQKKMKISKEKAMIRLVDLQWQPEYLDYELVDKEAIED